MTSDTLRQQIWGAKVPPSRCPRCGAPQPNFYLSASDFMGLGGYEVYLCEACLVDCILHSLAIAGIERIEVPLTEQEARKALKAQLRRDAMGRLNDESRN